MAKGKLLVNLKRDWFAPDGSLYQVRDNPHEFPADWEDQIPRIKVPKNPVGKMEPTEYVVDKDKKDEIIVGENTRTVVTNQQTASGDDVQVATAIGDDVKSVGGALDDKGVEQPNQTVAAAEKGAKELGAEVGGKPRESGPLPAGAQKK